ncbi:C39 family peptidase [Dorea sp. D27]|uniref:C39 family peptidase n=1 Tax=Dorea sp. D27 TaxID=658665 RepID=UPI0006732ABB|nr:C39 family peptidase [Dorea sp. D27]
MKTFSRVLSVCCVTALCSMPLSASAGTFPSEAGSAPAGTAVPADAESPVVVSDSGCSMPVAMYSQSDPSWAGYLYGGRDPMASYGCGPTALAIAVTSLTGQSVSPVDTAKWSYANGYFSPGRGSVHGLIPRGAESYGLKAEKLAAITPDSLRMVLSADKLLVLLMGPGDFSDTGHFIVAYGYDSSGCILIADPASPERSSVTWAAETLISQLSKTARDGGPVWVLSKP